MARAQIEKLRAAMSALDLSMFLVPTADPHGSEYVGDHFKARHYLSGFTGSAGTLAVGLDWAGLWTDGRYFIQAERELEGSGIELFRSGQPGVPELNDLLAAKQGKLGADFATLSAAEGVAIMEKGIEMVDAPDLVGSIWEDRPPRPTAPAFLLDIEYAGVSAADKLANLRGAMAKAGADACVMSTLEDIAWLFNIRGWDSTCTPIVLAYAIVERDAAYLFMDAGKARDVAAAMAQDGVTLLDYEGLYPHLGRYAGKRVIAPMRKLNYRMYLALSASELIEADPVGDAKAVKNPVELAHSRAAHLKDGVAVSRFMRYIKTHADCGLTEMDAAEKIDEYRREQEGYIGPSFATISGYGPNAAVIHYHATPETNARLEPRGLLLLDSGGQYMGGTTDVTRTIALGPVPDEQKAGFTMVLEGMLALLNAQFPYGCAGYHLDAIARHPFWERGMDFNHGTGHGVGYMLSVHEGPNGFRWKQTGRSDRGALEPGMITSDEPGIYVPGEYGVRTEILMECVEGETNAYGRFLRFESLTFAPIDLDAVDASLLSEAGRERLNRYHQQVYDRLSPLMGEEELGWLREYTRPI